jgi:hypothetical protein
LDFANLMFHLSIVPFPIGYLGPFALFPALLTEIIAFYLLQRRNFAPFSLISVVLLLANLPTLLLGYAFLAVMHHPEGQVTFSGVSFLRSKRCHRVRGLQKGEADEGTPSFTDHRSNQ